MKNEEKAIKLGQKYQKPCHGVGDCEFEAYMAAKEMAEWKDEILKQTLMRFFKYLDKRGFLDKDLQCDTEHQVETFLTQFNNQNN